MSVISGRVLSSCAPSPSSVSTGIILTIYFLDRATASRGSVEIAWSSSGSAGMPQRRGGRGRRYAAVQQGGGASISWCSACCHLTKGTESSFERRADLMSTILALYTRVRADLMMNTILALYFSKLAASPQQNEHNPRIICSSCFMATSKFAASPQQCKGGSVRGGARGGGGDTPQCKGVYAAVQGVRPYALQSALSPASRRRRRFYICPGSVPRPVLQAYPATDLTG